jgi:CheY-like chemotaxis protein
VLISDDDQGIRELYARLLADHGFEVLAAPRGDAALTLDLAYRARPHLLISDLNKPGGRDGLALRAALRADRRSARLPVLLVSAVELDRRAATLGPLDDYLPKPFGYEDLIERVAALLPLTPAEHDALAARVLARRSFAPIHPVTGLHGLHGLADRLPIYTAAPGWSAVALRLAGRRALLRAYSRPQLDLLLGRLGDLVRAAAAGLLAGHLGLDGQIGLVGPAPALERATAQIEAGFAPLAARLGRASHDLPTPALSVRRAGPALAPRPTPLDLRRALR